MPWLPKLLVGFPPSLTKKQCHPEGAVVATEGSACVNRYRPTAHPKGGAGAARLRLISFGLESVRHRVWEGIGVASQPFGQPAIPMVRRSASTVTWFPCWRRFLARARAFFSEAVGRKAFLDFIVLCQTTNRSYSS